MWTRLYFQNYTFDRNVILSPKYYTFKSILSIEMLYFHRTVILSKLYFRIMKVYILVKVQFQKLYFQKVQFFESIHFDESIVFPQSHNENPKCGQNYTFKTILFIEMYTFKLYFGVHISMPKVQFHRNTILSKLYFRTTFW